MSIFDLVLTLILAWGLIVIFFIDLDHQIIPDKILLPLVLIFLVYKTLNSLFIIHNSVFSFILPAFVSSLFLFLIFVLTKGKGMGFGDVKLAFLMGLFLGYPKVVVAFYLAFLTGAFFGIILVLIKKAKIGQKIAFGPFLVFGIFVSYLWGEKIISLVEKLLF